MTKQKLIDFLKKSKQKTVHITIPFSNGDVIYADDFTIEDTGEAIDITVPEIKLITKSEKKFIKKLQRIIEKSPKL